MSSRKASSGSFTAAGLQSANLKSREATRPGLAHDGSGLNHDSSLPHSINPISLSNDDPLMPLQGEAGKGDFVGSQAWYHDHTTPGSLTSDQYVTSSEYNCHTPNINDNLSDTIDPFQLSNGGNFEGGVFTPSNFSHQTADYNTTFSADDQLAQDWDTAANMIEPARNVQLLSPDLTNPSTPADPRGVRQKILSTHTSAGQPNGRLTVNDNGEHPQTAHLHRSTEATLGVNGSDARSVGSHSPRLTVETVNLVKSESLSPAAGLHYRAPSIQMHPPAESDDIPSRSGYAPDQRGQEEGPSIEDLEKSRHLDATRQNVEQWLDESDVGSDVENRKTLGPNKGLRSRLRAKSASDVNRNKGVSDAHIPGPGVTIHERYDDLEQEYDDEDEAEDEDASSESSSVRAYRAADEPPKPLADFTSDGTPDSANITQRPPWTDATVQTSAALPGSQPFSSNAAMQMFLRRTKETDSASITATIGSRRRSFSDMGSLYSGVDSRRSSIFMSSQAPQTKPAVSARRPTLLGNFFSTKMASINSKKRKESDPKPTPPEMHARKDSQSSLKIERAGSWGNKQSFSSDRADAQSPTSATSLTPTSPLKAISGVIRRSRSRSDINARSGLGEMLFRQGGPPMLSLPKGQPEQPIPQSADVSAAPKPSTNMIADNDDDDEDEEDVDNSPLSVNMALSLKIRHDPIIPTHEGFKQQIQTLNPRLNIALVDRFATEQVKRYKRLMENRLSHAKMGHSCPSRAFCSLRGGGTPEYLTPKSSGKGPDSQAVIFYIKSDKNLQSVEGIGGQDSSLQPANIPDGVPIPPVERLPAKFECPLCFEVKTIWKPSDWTKHVHEDLQPFTCTFIECNRPQSFKRKADWVRHEGELHRQLERWVCNQPNCPKKECFRKNNFVHHLGREHGIKHKQNGASVASLVQTCREDLKKNPAHEPCRFCHNLLTNWKAHSVHLAKHLEQIGMPMLTLVDQMAGSQSVKRQTQDIASLVADVGGLHPFGSVPLSQSDEGATWMADPTMSSDDWDPSTVTAAPSQQGLSTSASPLNAAEYLNPNMVHPENMLFSPDQSMQQMYGGQLHAPQDPSNLGDRRLSASHTYPQFSVTSGHGEQTLSQNAYLANDYSESPVEAFNFADAVPYPNNMPSTYPPAPGSAAAQYQVVPPYDGVASYAQIQSHGQADATLGGQYQTDQWLFHQQQQQQPQQQQQQQQQSHNHHQANQYQHQPSNPHQHQQPHQPHSQQYDSGYFFPNAQ